MRRPHSLSQRFRRDRDVRPSTSAPTVGSAESRAAHDPRGGAGGHRSGPCDEATTASWFPGAGEELPAHTSTDTCAVLFSRLLKVLAALGVARGSSSACDTPADAPARSRGDVGRWTPCCLRSEPSDRARTASLAFRDASTDREPQVLP